MSLDCCVISKKSRTEPLHVLFGAGLTHVSYHVEDQDLASVSYVYEGRARVLYVVSPSDCNGFKRAVSRYMLSAEYLNARDWVQDRSLQ